MLKRFLTGMVIIALTIGFFALRFVSPYFLDVYFLAISLFACFEVSKAFQTNGKKNDLYFVFAYNILTYIAVVIFANQSLNFFVTLGIIFGVLIVVFLINLGYNILSKNRMNKEMINVSYVGGYKRYATKKTLLNLFLMIYPALIISMFFLLNHFTDFSNFVALNHYKTEAFLLIMIFVTTIVTDTSAYLVGSGLKGPKLCPKISPNKTISGAIGGVLLSTMFSMLMFLLFSSIGYNNLFATKNLTLLHFAIYGLIASIFTQLGDIFASYIKRKNNIKDYGKIFPGHGGVMDRVDGLMINGFVSLLIFALIF